MNNYFEQIELYVTGSLTGDRLEAFEKSMAMDPALKTAVENHDVARLVFEGMEEQDIRNEIDNIKVRESKARLKFWWIGIGISVLILLGLIFWMSGQKADVEVLYANYMSEIPVELEGGRSDNSNTVKSSRLQKFKIAFDSMKEGNVESALPDLDELIENGFDDAIFYRALCYMKLGEIPQAIKEAELAVKKGDKRARELLSDLGSLE